MRRKLASRTSGTTVRCLFLESRGVFGSVETTNQGPVTTTFLLCTHHTLQIVQNIHYMVRMITDVYAGLSVGDEPNAEI